MVLEERERGYEEREKGEGASLQLGQEDGIRLEKSNILILGPTGSGTPATAASSLS